MCGGAGSGSARPHSTSQSALRNQDTGFVNEVHFTGSLTEPFAAQQENTQEGYKEEGPPPVPEDNGNPEAPSPLVGTEEEPGASPPWTGPLSCSPFSFSAQVLPPGLSRPTIQRTAWP